MTDNPFAQWVDTYYDDPVAFAKDMLGIELFPYQRGPLIALAAGQRKIALRSGHGTGKSTVLAIAALWFLTTRYPCKIVATAPTLNQIDAVLMGEVRAMLDKLPAGLKQLIDVTRDKVFLKAAPDEAWLGARTARAEAPEALAGIHSQHVLLLVDEASGVPEAVFEHSVGSMSSDNAAMILASNPTRRTGMFAKVFLDAIAGQSWFKYHFSSEDSPLVSKHFVQQIKETYGENSNEFRVRVLGEFPTEETQVFIPYHLIESASRRNIEISGETPGVVGLDPARFGDDSTAMCLRRANSVEEVKRWQKADLMETTGRVVAYLAAFDNLTRPVEVVVDANGIGAGVADRLKEVIADRGWSTRVIPVNVSESASLMPDQAYRLRDELWLQVKLWLERKECRIPPEPDLLAELGAPTYRFMSNGTIRIEPKDEMRKRLKGSSPDIADALCLTFAGLHGRIGTAAHSNWSKPLQRNLKGVA